MRRQIPAEKWEQIKTAYFSGIGLREIARNLNIPIGTILAKASREHWSRRIEAAKSLTKPVETEIVPVCTAAALTMRERAERHVERMAGLSEKILPHLESMEPAEILDKGREVELYDRWSRRTYDLDSQSPANCPLNINILTDQAAVQVTAKSA